MRTKEMTVLKILAEYEILTLAQLSALCFSSKKMAGRVIRELSQKGLLGIRPRAFGKSAGRPENIYSLNVGSIRLLTDSGYLDKNLSVNRLTDIARNHVEHQLLVNWTRILLVQMETRLPGLKVDFLAPYFNHDSYQISIEGSGIASTLIPDGIFSLSCASQSKAILFFLEVDMGTETLSSRNLKNTDIHNKILSYQHIFRTCIYKKFEHQFQTEFMGFRTLFIADTNARLGQLCRLTRAIRSTGFIWLTDRESMFDNGISDKIWVKGGDIEQGGFSILGPTLTFKNPFTPLNGFPENSNKMVT